MSVTVERILSLLPQTQCGECGHPGCRPYAEALHQGEAINRCLPGGDATVQALAQLLNQTVLPLAGTPTPARLAWVRESDCIGCTKCIQACPVDAILGSAQKMHTVIAEECTGCGLCLPPCPVDCIEWRPSHRPEPTPAPVPGPRAQHYRQRFEAREQRLSRLEAEQAAQRQQRLQTRPDTDRNALIAEAIARAQARKQGEGHSPS